jgi:hypothetical protein
MDCRLRKRFAPTPRIWNRMYPDSKTLHALYAEVLRLREYLERISGSSQARMIETTRCGPLRAEKPEEKKAT